MRNEEMDILGSRPGNAGPEKTTRASSGEISASSLQPWLTLDNRSSPGLATDIFTLLEAGLEQHSGREFLWPVSNEQYINLAAFVWQAYENLCRSLPPNQADVVLADSRYVGFLINRLHALAVVSFCRESDLEVLVGPLSKETYDPNWKVLSESFGRQIEDNRWKYMIRGMAKNAAFWLRNRPSASGKGRRAVVLGSATSLLHRYVERKNIAVHFLYWPNMYSGGGNNKYQLENALSAAVEDFFRQVLGYCSENFRIESDLALEKAAWLDRLRTLSHLAASLMSKRLDCDQFMFTETARPLNKLAAHVLRRKGVHAVAFAHGNSTGGLLEKSQSYFELNSCDEFVCESAGAAESYAKVYDMTGMASYMPTRFSYIETEHYRNILRESQNVPFPEKVRSVMLIGFPMNHRRYFDTPSMFFRFHIDLEMRLVKVLTGTGFHVIYKVHPERKEGLAGVFENLGAEVSSEPFEKVWPSADALLFKHASTTTFGYSLCLNRPIFMLDYEKDYWLEGHYELLSQRCRMIHSHVDENDRIMFDEEALLAALREKQALPDYSYVERYLFPRGKSADDGSGTDA